MVMNINNQVEIPQMSAAVMGEDGQYATITQIGIILAKTETPFSTIYVVEVSGCEMEFDETELRPVSEAIK